MKSLEKRLQEYTDAAIHHALAMRFFNSRIVNQRFDELQEAKKNLLEAVPEPLLTEEECRYVARYIMECADDAGLSDYALKIVKKINRSLEGL